MQDPIHKPTLMSPEEKQKLETFASSIVGTSGPDDSMADKRKRALEALKQMKSQPGHPSKEMMIRQVMGQYNCTRAQAKVKIKKFDEEMIDRFIKIEEAQTLEQSVSIEKVNPLALNTMRAIGFQV